MEPIKYHLVVPNSAPRGWGFVTTGKVQSMDKIWNPEVGKFVHANEREVDTNAHCWKAVIREGHQTKLDGSIHHRISSVTQSNLVTS